MLTTEIENIEITSLPSVEEESSRQPEIPPKADRKIDFALPQYNKFRRRKRISYVFNQKFIAHQRSNRQERCTALQFLNAEPVKVVKIAWRLFAIAAACPALLLSIHLLYPLPLLYSILGGFLGISIALIAAYESRLRIRFVTELGEVTVAELYLNLPANDQTNEFIEKASKAIAQEKTHLPTGKQRLAIEVSEHRRMFEEGQISQPEYERAKRRIFDLYSSDKT